MEQFSVLKELLAKNRSERSGIVDTYRESLDANQTEYEELNAKLKALQKELKLSNQRDTYRALIHDFVTSTQEERELKLKGLIQMWLRGLRHASMQRGMLVVTESDIDHTVVCALDMRGNVYKTPTALKEWFNLVNCEPALWPSIDPDSESDSESD